MASEFRSDLRSLYPTFVLQDDRARAPKATNANTLFLSELLTQKTPEERAAALATAAEHMATLCHDREIITSALYGDDGRHIATAERSASKPWTLIAGRHSACDILAIHAGISLRHLALVYRAGHPLQVFDLRSGTQPTLASGERLSHTTFAPPLALGLDSMWLLIGCGPTPAKAWLGAPSPLLTAKCDNTRWLFNIEHYAIDYKRDSAANAPCAQQQLCVSKEQLLRGILVGRSERCDAPSDWQKHPSDLSRVHALIVQSGKRAYLLDTASSGGVHHLRLGKTRMKRIVAGDVFWLGKQTRLSIERVTR